MLMRFVVVDFENLSKRSFANHFEDLVPICNVIMRYVRVRTLKWTQELVLYIGRYEIGRYLYILWQVSMLIKGIVHQF